MALGLALSVLIGVALGLLGGGGSILTLPILVYAMGMDAKVAIATSLFVVGVTSAVGSIAHARAGRVKYRTGLVFGAAGMMGAFGGGRVAHLIPANFLLLGFSCVMFATAIAMLRGRNAAAPSDGKALPLARVFGQGMLVGAISGLVGAGGGFLVVPAMTLLAGLPMANAIGTSLLVIAMQSMAGLLGHLGHVSLDWTVTLAVTGAAVAGSFLGARLSGKIAQDTLRKGFGAFVMVMALYLVNKQLPPSVVQSELYQLLVVRAWPAWGLLFAIVAALVLRKGRAAQRRAHP